MTAEEAVAGLVLCACELLRAARGEAGGVLPPPPTAVTTSPAEATENTAFSEKRFEELSGGDVRRQTAESESGDVSRRSGDAPAAYSYEPADAPAAYSFEPADISFGAGGAHAETSGFTAMLASAVRTMENAGLSFAQTRADSLGAEAERTLRRYPAAGSFESFNPSSAPSPAGTPTGYGKGADFSAERFSEFLERDSRRYDSGYEFY